MQKKLISTGKAAKLCSVSPDTVLKWIKKNQLVAVKTVGGHYRVDKADLQPYMVSSYNEIIEESDTKPSVITYCWEYHANNGQINDNCRDCMIFKTKAEKCFLMAELGKKGGHSQSYCTTSCYECEYFHYVNKSASNVLIITENKKIEKNLKKNVTDNLILKFSCCGYETATIIQDFHPDYIILDESLVNSNSNEICKHLINDPRLHGSQIIIAITSPKKKKRLPEGVCATLKIPFSVSDMDECFANLQKNFFGGQPNGSN